jgi:hypothetical protein
MVLICISVLVGFLRKIAVCDSHTVLRPINTTPLPGSGQPQQELTHTPRDSCQALTIHYISEQECNHRVNQDQEMLPEDGHLCPKHIGATVVRKEF